MEIRVNDYVRTKKGRIGKVLLRVEANSGARFFGERLEDTIIELNTYDNLRTDTNSIIKHSPNIVDLIEVGDIVEVFDVLHNDIVYIWNEEMLKALKEDIENGIQIKSIVTNEQFNSIKYEVE